jgi:hypothetical protein
MHNEEYSAHAETAGQCKIEFHKLFSKLKLGQLLLLMEQMFWKLCSITMNASKSEEKLPGHKA